MALKRTLTFVLPLVAAAGVAIAILPPRPAAESAGFFAWQMGGYVPHAWPNRRSWAERDVEAAVRNLNRRVDQARRGDSLLALRRRGGRAERSADGQITVLYESPLTADSARRWLHAAERELDLYPGGAGPGAPVIVALFSDSMRRDNSGRGWWVRRQYVREAAPGTVCVVEINVLPKLWNRRRTGRPLDACALYARFGPPGTEEARWLGQGAAREYLMGYLRGSLADAVVDARQQRPPRVAEWEWRPVWMPSLSQDERQVRWPPYWWQSSACLARGEACEAAAGFDASSAGRTAFWYWRGGAFSAGSVVADLLANRDPTQFAAFWRSDLPTTRALQAAYGKPAAQLVREAMLRKWIPAPHGPTVTSRIVGAAVGWMAAALGLAILAGWRRQARS